MKTIGASEAKTHFARLLERVANGEQARRAISRLMASRKGRRLGGLSWKDLRDEACQGQSPS